MKNLFFGLLATVFMSLNCQAGEPEKGKVANKAETIHELDRVKITIHFVPGRKSRDCKGFGICEFDIVVDVEFDLPFQITMLDTGRLKLETNKVGFNQIVSWYGSGTIILEENYVLKAETCRALGIPYGYTIKTGKYPLMQDATGVFSTTF